ncbi:MAG: arsenate reductase (glutaredoxin) [Myxococcales bacterium]|nr:arsenate reductase (glutaredoxin) [Myxococcales bacterium]
MLDEKKIAYRYREYTEEPLSKTELKKVLKLLGVEPTAVLRKNDKAYKDLGLTGDESKTELIELMAAHPTLLQRPIGVTKDKAALGRPIENLLTLAD